MAWATAHAFEPKDPMSRSTAQPEHPPKVTDLLIRQKCESMIKYGYVALRQFPKFERHVLAAELRTSMWALLRLIVVCNKRHHKKTTLQDLDAEPYGGGGAGGGIAGSSNHPGGTGGYGAVRILWGAGRSYPSTNTGDV